MKSFDTSMKINPEATFIGEEGEQNEFSEKGKFFIVDPIDGTTNFNTCKKYTIKIGWSHNDSTHKDLIHIKIPDFACSYFAFFLNNRCLKALTLAP